MEQRDRFGRTEAEFLAQYDENKYRHPSVTVDMAIFTPDAKKLLLIRRKNHPFIGGWALPGGFVDMEEDLESAAKRELFEETGVKGASLKQVMTFGAPYRDPRTRVISVLYTAVLPEINPTAGDDAAEAEVFDLDCTLLGVSDGCERLRIRAVSKTGEIAVESIVGYRTDGFCESVEVLGRGNSENAFASDHAAMIFMAYRAVKALAAD